jgi:hypothetical protein
MQKLSNFTGQARHGWEKMTPAAFSMGRTHLDNVPPSQREHLKRQHGSSPMSPLTSADPVITLSFNIPFASNLGGPEREEILHASPSALQRWLHPLGTPEVTPTHRLPVHMRNVENLRKLCKVLSDSSNGRLEASVTSSEPKPMPNQRIPRKGFVTNVCVTSDSEMAYKMRGKILNETPIALV